MVLAISSLNTLQMLWLYQWVEEMVLFYWILFSAMEMRAISWNVLVHSPRQLHHVAIQGMQESFAIKGHVRVCLPWYDCHTMPHVLLHDTAYPSNVMASATSNTTIFVSWSIPTEFYSSITNYWLYLLHKTVNQLVFYICIHAGWNVKATLLVWTQTVG